MDAMEHRPRYVTEVSERSRVCHGDEVVNKHLNEIGAIVWLTRRVPIVYRCVLQHTFFQTVWRQGFLSGGKGSDDISRSF